jgi:hypothetical protein
MRKWKNKLNNESKTNKTTTRLLDSRAGNTVEMMITNILTQHTVVIVTKINVHKTIADDHPREIAPVKLLPLPLPPLRARTDARTNPSTQRATQLRSVLARV